MPEQPGRLLQQLHQQASGATVYTGPAVGGLSRCPWSYTPPCPAGYYKRGRRQLCLPCPQWSNSSAGASSLSQCSCMAGRSGVNGSSTIPSPFKTPSACGPLSTCPAYVQPPFPFPLLTSCQYATDSPSHVCLPVCLAGQWIQHIPPRTARGALTASTARRGGAAPTAPTSCRLMQPSLKQSSCVCAACSWDATVSSTPPVHVLAGQAGGVGDGLHGLPEQHLQPHQRLGPLPALLGQRGRAPGRQRLRGLRPRAVPRSGRRRSSILYRILASIS